MSCSTLKHRLDHLKTNGTIQFDEAVNLYNDVKGSLDAHRMELDELMQAGNTERAEHLRAHIKDGETMLSDLQKMTLQ